MASVSRILNFTKRQFLIARITGIPIKIDYRWFPVLIIVSWLISASLPVRENSSGFVNFLIALLTTLVFFASILVHELAHAVTARLEGIQIIEILLHPFGGLARFDREPEDPRSEFRIAIAGPAASFLVALFFLALIPLSNAIKTNILSLLLFTLFFLNLLLAVFNLFPGYPLDGGRVLRAYLWKRGYDLNAATVLTGRAGQIIALALIIFGGFIAFVRADFFTGFWSILVGLFLFEAAGGIIKQISRADRLLAKHAMEIPVSVSPEMFIQSFVDHVLPLHRQSVFLVAKERQLYGFFTLEDLKKVPREDWSNTTIQTKMRIVTNELFVETETPLNDARELLRTNEIGALGVIDKDGYLVGFLQRGRIRTRTA